MRWLSITLVAILVTTAFPLLCRAQKSTSSSARKLDIQLVATYKKNELYDISPDAKMLLFYGASTPIKATKSPSLTEWNPKPAEKYSKALRVVRWEDGHELGRIPLQYLHNARFIEGTTHICFEEKGLKLWDYLSALVTDCNEMPAAKHLVIRGFFEKAYSSSGKYKAEASVKTIINLLVAKQVRGVITIFDRGTGKKLGTASHPTDKKWAENIGAGSFYGLALTGDDGYLITYYGFDTYIWRLNGR